VDGPAEVGGRAARRSDIEACLRQRAAVGVGDAGLPALFFVGGEGGEDNENRGTKDRGGLRGEGGWRGVASSASNVSPVWVVHNNDGPTTNNT
jgi:hypothetical protein